MERYIHKVNYYETDKMGITHHSNYIRFMEEARVDFLDKIGWGYAKMEEEGVASPVLAVTCDYRHSTTFADEIEIEVSVLKCTAVRLQIGYTMYRRGETVCTGTSTHCFLGRDGCPLVISKAMSEFYEALAAFASKGE